MNVTAEECNAVNETCRDQDQEVNVRVATRIEPIEELVASACSAPLPSVFGGDKIGPAVGRSIREARPCRHDPAVISLGDDP